VQSWTHPSWPAQMQCSRESHSNLQRPFHCSVNRSPQYWLTVPVTWYWLSTATRATSMKKCTKQGRGTPFFIIKCSLPSRQLRNSQWSIQNQGSRVIRVGSRTRIVIHERMKGVMIGNILQEMGHPQPLTPVQTDNSTADRIINLRVLPKHTKAMDMRFHWLSNRATNQRQFRFYWRPEKHIVHLSPPTLQTENYCSSPLHSSVRGDYRRPRIL
jgi:hypothetical protein